MRGPGGAVIMRRALLGLIWCGGDPMALDTMDSARRALILALDEELDLVTWSRRVDPVRMTGR
jgi:hypothetical protein